MLHLKAVTLYAVIVSASCDSIAQETKDSTSTVSTSGKVLVANAGFAPISAFSFNSPIIIGSLAVKWKRFSYEPDVAFGLNGKPLIISNWFRFYYVKREKIKLKISTNPGLFFRADRNSSGEEVIHAQRNFNIEFGSEIRISPIWSLAITYMHNTACDLGGLSGHYLDASNYFPDIPLSKTIAMNLKPQLFYFDFEGNIDGLFTSASMRVIHKKIPISVYGQGVLPLWTNFTGNSFKWNAGLIFEF